MKRLANLLPLLLAIALPGLFGPWAHPFQQPPEIAPLLARLPWRNVGPAIMGGRIDDVAVVESRPATVYVATASGGLLKTTNNGTTWTLLFDEQPVSTIGDVTLAPSNPEIVWVGTGEPNNRQSSSWGNGVYRSTDGGRSWAHLGLADTHHIGRIAVDPRDPDVAYVAAVGHLWGANAERGVFKTADGGKSWAHSLRINEDTGCVDLAIDPEDSQVLYAAAYQRRRTPFGFNGGGPGSGIYKTTDGGASWRKLTGGLPGGDTGRIGLCVYRKEPRIVYAIVENAQGGVFRSEDRGESWQRMSSTNPRPMYYSKIHVDPNDDQRIWVLGASMYVSRDAGRSFSTNAVSRIHGDFHALWINPKDSEQMVLGSDGGIHWSWDRGQTWDFVNSIPLAQFYEVAYDFRRPYWVYGGLQDNGSWMGPSATPTQQGPTNADWERIGGGDGFYVQVDPTDHNSLYVESQNGALGRLNAATGERKSIRPRPEPGEAPYRFDWNSPILISPHNPRKLLFGGNRLFITTDRGDTWRRTEDLSSGPDRTKLPIMGVLPGREVLSLHDGQASFGQIVTVSESPLRAGVLWAGTDDGNLQVSRDDGATWKNVAASVPGLPKGTYVSRVVASHHGAGRCYATFDGHRGDDFTPYVFVSEDYGESWKSIRGNLPEGGTVSVVREHHRNPTVLFVGTERGAWVSFDRGGAWHRFGAPLPTVPVDDIQVHPRENDLILATHGRGVWILDDITPLEELAEKALTSGAVLFTPRSAVAYRLRNHTGSTGHNLFIAPNPQPGALIQFYLKERPAAGEPVKLSILSADGNTVVREMTLVRTEAGIQRVTWDMRHAPPVAVQPGPASAAGGPGAGLARGGPSQAGAAQPGTGLQQPGVTRGGAGRGGGGALRGPRALPGTYVVRLTVGQLEFTRPLKLEEDPRISLTNGERRALFELQVRVGALLREADQARRGLQALRDQLTILAGSDGLKAAPQDLKDAVAALAQKAAALGDRFQGALRRGPAARQDPDQERDAEQREMPRGPSSGPLIPRLSQLLNGLDAITEPPSRAARRESDTLATELRQVFRETDALMEGEVAALNRRLRALKLPEVSAPARKG